MFWIKTEDEKFEKFVLKNQAKFLFVFTPVIYIISILNIHEIFSILVWTFFATFLVIGQLQFVFHLLRNKINGKKIIYEGGWGAFFSKRDYIVYLEK